MTIGISALLFAAALASVGAALVVAAWSDLTSFTIPNRYCAIIAVAYPLALADMSLSAWAAGLATGLAVLLLGGFLFARHWIGGGDIKLASAVALWAGPAFLDDFLMVMSLAGALLAAAILFTPLPRLLGGGHGSVEGFTQPMPFGVPIAAAGLWVVTLKLVSF